MLKKLGKKRLLLSDDQRRLLAAKGHALGRKVLHDLTTIVTPDTILRWHRELVAKKWDQSGTRKTVGRPLERAIDEYLGHYHAERNHQGLNNELIEPEVSIGIESGKIECRERLGGLLKYYRRAA